MADGTSDAAKAGRATRTEIGRAAASHTYVATARVRQRGLDNRRVRSESIMRSKPSADPAAARCKRRISRASHRQAGGTRAPGADASSRWSRSQYNAFGPMAANESSGLSFYPLGHESAGPNPRFRGGFALRHALFQLVAACFAAAWQVASLGVSGNSKRRKFTRVPHAARACATRAYFEMASSAMPLVRGPMNPIAAITITIAPAMNANTPNVPKPFSTAAITNDEKIAEKRLHE